jgi:hypothetical protein
VFCCDGVDTTVPFIQVSVLSSRASNLAVFWLFGISLGFVYHKLAGV